jgi:hypothetical protein
MPTKLGAGMLFRRRQYRTVLTDLIPKAAATSAGPPSASIVSAWLSVGFVMGIRIIWRFARVKWHFAIDGPNGWWHYAHVKRRIRDV